MSATPEALWRLHPMSEHHLAWVTDIEQRSYEFPWTEGLFRDCLRVGYSCWVVTDTINDVLAYGLMSMAVGEAHILNICVDPRYRKQGLARYLMRHLLGLLQHAAIDDVFLEVRASNQAAQRLYAALGFAQVGRRKAYYPARNGREDAVVMKLPLGGERP